MTRRHSITVITMAVWAGLSAASAATLPAPDGQYAVGVATTEFVDSSRLLDEGDPSSGPRRLPAIVWYPASDPADAQGSAYLERAVAATTLPGHRP